MVIKYTLKEIQFLLDKIDTILEQNILNKLIEIKKNNKIIKRNNPIKLKYILNTDLSKEWRNKKDKDDE